MSGAHRIPRRPARLTIRSAAGTVIAGAAVAAAIFATGTSPSTFGASADVDRAGSHASSAQRPASGQHAASGLTSAQALRAAQLAHIAAGRRAAIEREAHLRALRRAERERAARRRAAQQRAARRAAAQRAEAAPKTTRPATTSQPAPSGSPQKIAMAMLPDFGWSSSQFGCLNDLWTRESGWNPSAQNPTSGAYGIPQALPGSKMASAGADWQTNPATQIKWGLGYIKSDYGSPCGAWAHEESTGWY